MIPKFVVPLIYVLVLVSAEGEVETNKIVKDVTSGNNATTPDPEVVKKIKNDQGNELVKIQLYYESLCGDCRRFDSNAFKQTVLELTSYLDVHLYPYGNAITTKDGKVICQHGPEECYGNKLHACAIDYLNNITSAVLFNSCLMSYSNSGKGSDDAAADLCGQKMGIDSETIKQCAKGPKGDSLLKYYGVESRKVIYNSVPHILINGEPGRDDHFKEDVCKNFKNPPEQCTE